MNLNRLVAERILGWEFIMSADRVTWVDGNHTPHSKLPDFINSLNYSTEVLDYLLLNKADIMLTPSPREYVITVKHLSKLIQVADTSLPVAICRAALELKEAVNGMEQR